MFTEPVQSRAHARLATRTKVLDAAWRLFLAQGYANTTIRRIAEEAQVSVGSVMAVADKRGLLVARVEATIEALQAEVPAGQPPASEATDVPVRVLTVLRPFLAFFAEHTQLAREYAGILVSGHHESVVFEDLSTHLIERVSGELAGVMPTASTAQEAARIIHQAYIGELFMWAASGSSDLQPTADHLQRTIRSIVDPHRS